MNAGLGFGLTPLWQIRELVDADRLKLLLAEAEPPPVSIHVVW